MSGRRPGLGPRRWATAAAALALTGCSAVTNSAESASVPADEASRSADRIYADALTAWGQVPGAHAHGTASDPGGSLVVDATLGQQTAVVRYSSPDGALIIIVTNGQAYTIVGTRTTRLSGDLAVEARSLTLGKAADCRSREHGTLTKGATTTVDGRAAIVINDDGRAPGAAAEAVYVSLERPTLILRIVDTSAPTPGGSLQCGHEPSSPGASRASGVAGTVDWDYLTDAPTITPPPGAAPAGG